MDGNLLFFDRVSEARFLGCNLDASALCSVRSYEFDAVW